MAPRGVYFCSMKILSFLIFCFSRLVYGQLPQGTVDADAVCFVRGTDSVSLELYYAIQHGALRFTGGDTSWSADIPVVTEIWQDDKRVAVRQTNKQMTFRGTQDELRAMANHLALDMARFDIPARKNTVAYVIFQGTNTEGEEVPDTLRRLVYVPVVRKDSFVFSGVEFAASLQPASSSENLFYKAGYIMLPNPSLIFGGDYSALNFYTELNVPQNASGAGDSVTMVIRILDGAQNEIVSRQQTVAFVAPRMPFLGSLDIDGLATDSYSLVITATFKGKTVAVIRKGFFIESGMIVSEEANDEQPVAADDEMIYQTSDISKYSDLELGEKIEQSAYVMPNDIRKAIVKTKNAGEKKRMLYKFWRSRDEEGTRPLSAFRRFNDRVEEANRQFTYQKTIGWKTHRGRIYITYGKPEKISGEPFSTESKPYIIWEYFSRGFQLSSGSRAEFVFVDLYGGGNFQLVHSNVRGEVSQPNWYSNDAYRLR